MTYPLCAYCGHEIDEDTHNVFYCNFPEIPGDPKIAWHWNLDKSHKDRLCCFSMDGHDGNALASKVSDGDLAAIVTIMARGKGRVKAGREFGAHLKEQGIKIERSKPPSKKTTGTKAESAKGQLALI